MLEMSKRVTCFREIKIYIIVKGLSCSSSITEFCLFLAFHNRSAKSQQVMYNTFMPQAEHL